MNKETDIKLSVIIKTQNSEKYLFEILESLQEADEVIVADFNSNDETVAIAKEYKTRIIFFDKTQCSNFEELINQTKNDWVLILDKNELIPQKLVNKISKIIENPPKNINIFAFSKKSFYLNKEIKLLREKSNIRLFKKGSCTLKCDFSLEIKGKNKVKNINKNFKNKNEYILKFIDNNISSNLEDIIEKNKNILKTKSLKGASIIIKPLLVFFRWYILKGGIFEGKRGYLFSKMKFIEEFILQIMILEKSFKGEKYDI